MATPVTDEIIAQTKQEAAGSERKRAIYKFHQQDERCQRMVNVLRRGTYVRPHRHQTPPKAEHFLIREGRVAYVGFEADGRVAEIHILNEAGPVYGVDILPGEIHSLVCLSDEAVLHEIIDGFYDPESHKDYATFAPEEKTPEGSAYLKKLEVAIESG